MKVIEERTPDFPMSIQRVGGNLDGETFRLVEVTLEDGTRMTAFKSDYRKGYFRQVFAPLDFDHPALL